MKSGRRSEYQVLNTKEEKNAMWLKGEYETSASKKSRATVETVKLRVYIGLMSMTASMDVPEPATSTTTTTRQQVATVQQNMEGSEDTTEDSGGQHSAKGSAQQTAIRMKDTVSRSGGATPVKPVSVTSAQKLEEMVKGMKKTPALQRYPLKNNFEVAMQLLTTVPGLVEALAAAQVEASQTNDPATFSQSDKCLLEGMTSALAFTSKDRRLQQMAMANCLLGLMFLNGKVQTVAMTLEEIVKQLENLPEDIQLPGLIRILLRGNPEKSEGNDDILLY
ncbi:PREDICTED: uncharacterized protein LOC109488111 [Branchiostoma belcheri]|uniref:Uncharacterized protein LOC109488111 n=1 Tax=Branchiostoma belcheri TaxID=7741 RepID=A0A6P5ANW7_BRABE|nr:PREDICTED: uncharacterized protein LOC109488111 [Branchiostoma belcheri]